MKKKGKKILLSLAATMLLSTSVGQAASYNNRSNTYNRNNNRTNNRVYVISYDKNYYNYLYNWGNLIIRWDPVGWEENKPSEPTTPVEETETPNSNIGNEKENQNQKENNNQKPSTRPSNPTPETEVDSNTAIEKEVVRLVNIEREKAGLAPLAYSEELSRVARIKSQDMADKNYFSHTSPTYGDPFNMMRSFGIKYRTAGENIAKGYSSAKSVVNGWMNSSGHRANILNPSFGKIGVGYVKVNGTTYWTQLFTD